MAGGKRYTNRTRVAHGDAAVGALRARPQSPAGTFAAVGDFAGGGNGPDATIALHSVAKVANAVWGLPEVAVGALEACPIG